MTEVMERSLLALLNVRLGGELVLGGGSGDGGINGGLEDWCADWHDAWEEFKDAAELGLVEAALVRSSSEAMFKEPADNASCFACEGSCSHKTGDGLACCCVGVILLRSRTASLALLNLENMDMVGDGRREMCSLGSFESDMERKFSAERRATEFSIAPKLLD